MACGKPLQWLLNLEELRDAKGEDYLWTQEKREAVLLSPKMTGRADSAKNDTSEMD